MRAGMFLLIGCTPELTTPDALLDAQVSTTDCDWLTPDNSWPTAEPLCLEAEGFEVGEIVPDIRLLDQNGDEVSLWQFYGDLIFMDISAEWCAPCSILAEGAAELMAEVEGEGVSMVTIMFNGGDSDPLTQEELQSWADKGGNIAPVLADDGTWTNQVIPPGGSYPALILIDRDMRVLLDDIRPPNDYAVLHAIEENL